MDGAQKKILLIEDDPFIVSLLSQAFQKEGFAVAISSDGEKAPADFSKFQPDIMLVDILLPKKNGIEVLREIRALPGGEKTHAIIFSNLEDANYIKDAEALHVKGYLIKANVQLPEIVAKVKQILGML